MQLEPCGRFEWERALEAITLPRYLKNTAHWLPMYGNSDGTRIHPGERRLARALGVSERTVREHLRELRALGLIERVALARGNQFGWTADEYRLSLPDDLLERFGSHLPDGSYRKPVAGTEVRHRKPTSGSKPSKEPRHRKPVAGSETLLTSSHRKPDVPLPETQRRATGSGLPDTKETKDVHQGENSGFSCDVAKEEGESYPLKAERDSSFNGGGFDYASASAFLLTLSDYGAEAVAEAETELGPGADRTDVITRAASIARRAA